MPHYVGGRWSGAARYATAFALLVAYGCTSDDGGVLVIVTDESARAVIAAPVDPRALRATGSSRSATPAVARSIARYYAATDSADSLDAAFQAARDSLNREARALAGADRRGEEYARRFDGFMARVGAATRTREARDRARRHAATLRAQLGADAPDPARRHDAAGTRLRAALDSAAQASGREVVRVTLRNRQSTLEVEPGVWWLAVERDDGLLTGVRRHEVRPGTRDTVRIGG
jgi:hypothetical protein